MSDGNQGQQGGADGQQQGADGGQQGGQQQGADGGQQRAAAPEWLGRLGDESLRTNEHLGRYQSIDDLAKAHVETVTWARGRVPLPKADDEKGRADFIAKARPEKAEQYEVPVPEGQPAERAEAFKEKAFQLGLMPWQVKELAEWDNGHMADAVSRMQQGAKDELKAIELDLGPAGYARGMEAVNTMLGAIKEKAGIDTDMAMVGLEKAYGAGAAAKLLLHFAQATGELDKVDGAAVAMRMGAMTPEKAQETINARMNDAEFMAKAMQGGTPENQQWNDLNKAAAGA